MTHFREVQKFRQPWLWAILLAPVCVVGWGAYQQLVLHRPWGNKPMPDNGLVLLCAALALFVVWFFSVRLITEVRNTELILHFLLLWRKKIIPLGLIRSVEAVEYRPIRDYGGWGVRRSLAGYAYNVSGNRGVQLKFWSGPDILIGSQRPEELAAILEERRRAAGAGR